MSEWNPSRSQLIHIGVETVTWMGLVMYMVYSNRSMRTRIEELEEQLKRMETILQDHHRFLQQINLGPSAPSVPSAAPSPPPSGSYHPTPSVPRTPTPIQVYYEISSPPIQSTSSTTLVEPIESDSELDVEIERELAQLDSSPSRELRSPGLRPSDPSPATVESSSHVIDKREELERL
jgi:hypothetical protein